MRRRGVGQADEIALRVIAVMPGAVVEVMLGGEAVEVLVVLDKWLATLTQRVQGELDRVSQTLTRRIRELAERYSTPLPALADEVEAALASGPAPWAGLITKSLRPPMMSSRLLRILPLIRVIICSWASTVMARKYLII